MCHNTIDDKQHGEQEAEREFGIALFRVMRAVFMEHRPSPELDTLPLAQLRLLWAVYYNPDGTMKDFSERLRVTQSTVTQLADRLVRRGMVERHADMQDRRVVRLRASAGTRQVLDDVDEQRRNVERLVWDSLSDQEKTNVMDTLDLLGQTAEAVHARQGRPLPPLAARPIRGERAASSTDASQPQPVLDLMNRRVRGASSPGG